MLHSMDCTGQPWMERDSPLKRLQRADGRPLNFSANMIQGPFTVENSIAS